MKALALWMTLFAIVAGAGEVVDLSELSLEQLMEIEIPVVYAASKYEQKTTEAPASISIVTSDDIQRYGYRTLAEIVQSVPGFHVSYDRNYAFVGTRGVSLGDFNSRILLLVDGHRVNNNLTDGAYLGTAFPLDVDLIDRVEIIRGPGSVLYGNNAFFGVINVITRNGGSINGLEVSGDYGSLDSSKVRFSCGGSLTNGLEWMLSGSVYRSDGVDELYYPEFNSPSNDFGVARNMDADAYGSFFGSVSFKGFTIEGAYDEREKVNPTAQFSAAFNDPRLRTKDTRAYAALSYSHEFEGVVGMVARVYYDQSDFGIGYPLNQTVPTDLYKEQDAGEWWGAELQLNKRLWNRHQFTLGAEYRDDFRQDQLVYDANNPQVAFPRSDTRQSYGVYAQGDFAVRTNLHLNAGIRWDQIRSDTYGAFDSTLNPRVALIYDPLPETTLKFLYGTAFRAPNFLELSTGTSLDPEEITSFELVYEQRISKHFRSSVSGFLNDMNDLIVNQAGAFTNFDAEAVGVELALEGSWGHSIRGRLSYAWQDASNSSSEQALPDSPEHLVKFNLSVPLYKEKIFASAELQYIGNRFTSTGTTVLGDRLGSHTVINLTLFSQDLIQNLQLSASVYNLLDTGYSDPATRYHRQDRIPRDGRTFRVKLTYRF